MSSSYDAELESPPPYTSPYASYAPHFTTFSPTLNNSPTQCTSFPPVPRQTSVSTDEHSSTCGYEEVSKPLFCLKPSSHLPRPASLTPQRRRAQNRNSLRAARMRQIARRKKGEATIEDLPRKVERLEQEKGELEQKLEMTEGVLRKVVVQLLGGEGSCGE